MGRNAEHPLRIPAYSLRLLRLNVLDRREGAHIHVLFQCSRACYCVISIFFFLLVSRPNHATTTSIIIAAIPNMSGGTYSARLFNPSVNNVCCSPAAAQAQRSHIRFLLLQLYFNDSLARRSLIGESMQMQGGSCGKRGVHQRSMRSATLRGLHPRAGTQFAAVSIMHGCKLGSDPIYRLDFCPAACRRTALCRGIRIHTPAAADVSILDRRCTNR